MRIFTHRSSGSRISHRSQQGAVLYVALVILILMALIGLVGMQVTGLQERMAANYRNVNLAFQNAEADARVVEANIAETLESGIGTFSADQEVCAPVFDPATWAEETAADTATYTRRIDKCFAASSRRVGEKQNEETGNIYEISVLASDTAADASSSAVINTIFIP